MDAIVAKEYRGIHMNPLTNKRTTLPVVLIVDDNPAIRNVVGWSLQFGGFQPRIPIDHDVVFADQERNVEPERANRIRYFTNVHWIGLAELARVRFQGVNGIGFDLKRRKDVVSAGRACFFGFRMPHTPA